MKSPAFQFYPADYLSDMKVRMLSWASRGLYMDLLCYCWREGWIPSDSSAIAQLCHCHDLAIIEPCLDLFDSHPDDAEKLIHKRLNKERNKQLEHSNERSDAGKKGAKARWNKGKTEHGSAIVLPMAKNSSSSSSSSSTSVEKRTVFQKPSLEDVREYGLSLNPPFLNASGFINFYDSKGWVVGKSPMKDWKAAVRTWQSKDAPKPADDEISRMKARQ